MGRVSMDTDLVVRAQHGDEEAFASLAVAVGGRLHRVANGSLTDTGFLVSYLR